MRNRWSTIAKEQDKKPLKQCEPTELTPEETLFLALHIRSRFLDRIARSESDDEHDQWVNTIAAGFASLLEHCDVDDLSRVYHGNGPWHRTVRPPSVLAGELWVFLGGLSVDSQNVYNGCSKRGSVQAFRKLVGDHLEQYEWGREERKKLKRCS